MKKIVIVFIVIAALAMLYMMTRLMIRDGTEAEHGAQTSASAAVSSVEVEGTSAWDLGFDG